MNHNRRAWILLLITVILVPPTSVASYLSTTSINQLETSILPGASQQFDSQMNQLQESILIKPFRSVGYMTSMGMEEVVPNVTSTDGAFEGYNLFVLSQRSQTNYLDRIRSLLVTNMEGEIIGDNEVISFPQNVWLHGIEFINSTTLLYGTDERTGLPLLNAPVTLWNIYDKTSVNLGTKGHHEYTYNPQNNTIFTSESYYVDIDENEYMFDMITEYDTTGQLVWSLDTRSFISHTQWCPFHEMYENTRDITHGNSLFFDPDEDVFYYNVRNVNTFYKIDHKTGQVLWGLGEYGNFTLFDRSGTKRENLFYHSHSLEKVDENTFIMFDNDKHNQTNPMNPRSRMLEITINETTMTANESWSWTAPTDYYSDIYGDADRLPNGNRLGTFGTDMHPNSNIGARLVEVNDEGQIVWEMNFPSTDFNHGVYRLQRFRFNPILSPLPDIRMLAQENVTVSWQTWYNFRTSYRMRGSYTLYLDGDPIENGTHVFDKFWRPTNLTFNLGKLEPGDYNLTLELADEAGHQITDSLSVSIMPSYLNREGPIIIEYGQENARIQWKGGTTSPLLATLAINNTQLDSFVWNGSIITLDLNSFEAGTYLVSLQFFDNNELIYEDRFFVTIYPAAAPVIHSFPVDQSLMWKDSPVLSWELFDHIPASWSIFVNNTLAASDMCEASSYQLHWSVPILDEGRYNVTLMAYDLVGHRTTRTTWLVVTPPSPPVIAAIPQKTEFLWGQENTSLSWEIHGGTQWSLWKNGTPAYSGEVTSTRIEIWIENWQRDWRPGTYNLTLQVTENGGTTATHTSWIRIKLGDAYANSVIAKESMWYWDGEHALGPPDGKFAHLYFDYGNGHLTLDMGPGEEILDGKGVDFTVYVRRGEYAVFVGNNLSAPIVGNQTLPPLILLGEGLGNVSFDLANVSLEQARYIQIVYLAGEDVELDAVVALYFNQPPIPTSNSTRRNFLVSVIILVLAAIIVLWVRRRK